MFEKKLLIVENNSVKTWKPPPFHSEPSPSFLYPKEMKVLVAPPLLRSCLAHEKGKRENKRKYEASCVSFTGYRTECLQSLFRAVL